MDIITNWFSNLNLDAIITSLNLIALSRALLLIVAGWFIARIARLTITRVFSSSLTAQQRLLLRRGVSYTIVSLFFISALRELGFDFNVLLGAAGIVTVAIGFASQTSVSNVISGLFLVLERTVEVDNVVHVNGHTGVVHSIDLLSTKLRTFDNLLIRIPNETMLKSDITNYSRFPIRRIDTLVGVAYTSDLKKVKEVLLEVANTNPLSLDEPAPIIVAKGFGDSSIDFQFSVWGTAENYLELLNSIHENIKEAFTTHDIEIPYPHRVMIPLSSEHAEEIVLE